MTHEELKEILRVWAKATEAENLFRMLSSEMSLEQYVDKMISRLKEKSIPLYEKRVGHYTNKIEKCLEENTDPTFWIKGLEDRKEKLEKKRKKLDWLEVYQTSF